MLSGMGLLDHCRQAVTAKRFDHVVIHSGGQTDCPVLPRGIGSQGYDLRSWTAMLRDDFPRCLQSIHDRHLDIHQDQVKGFLLQNLKRLRSVGNDHRLVSQTVQHEGDNLLIDLVVLGKEDSHRALVMSPEQAR